RGGRDGAVAGDAASMRGARRDGDLGDALDAFAQARHVRVHVGAKLLGRRVGLSDLADLAADRNRHGLGLARADELREVGAPPRILGLLLGQRGLREIHQRRRVDVDLEEAGGDSLVDQGLDRGDLGLRVGLHLPGVRLVVVALEKDGTLPALADGRGQHDRGVLRRPLIRVADLAAGDLEDQGAGIEALGGPEGRAGRVVGEHADVDGRHREARSLALAAGLVERQDRRGQDGKRRRGFADVAPRSLAGFALSEHGRPGEAVHDVRAEPRGVCDGESAPAAAGRFRERNGLLELGGRGEEVHGIPPAGGGSIRPSSPRGAGCDVHGNGSARLYESLARVLPSGSFSREEEALQAHASDETEDLTARPQAVVTPRSEQEVVALMTLAQELAIPVTPQGARTGLSGGALPVSGGVALDLTKLDRLVEIDRDNLFAVAEPGVVTQRLQEAVEAVGLFYPPDPASRGSCTIGGNIAENAGGPRAARYGTTGRYVSGLRVVLPGGKLPALGGENRKDGAGYGLVSLFVGSEGTLGVVTQARLRPVPPPPHRRLLWASFQSEEAALGAVARLFAAGREPSACEFLERRAAEVAAASLAMG